MKPRREPEELRQLCVKAHTRVIAGEAIEHVCKDLGMGSSAQYYVWRRKLYGEGAGKYGKREKPAGVSLVKVPATQDPKPIHHSFPIAEPPNGNDTLVIKGSPKALARFIREFTEGLPFGQGGG